MTELKTLRDLEISADNPMYTMGAQDQRKVLRQEAIKWIKRLGSPKYHFGGLGIEYSHKARDSIIIWIKHFFNITDKDLGDD